MKKRLFLGALAGVLGGLAMKAMVRFIDRDAFGLSAKTDARTTHEICRRMNWQRLSERRAEQVGAAMHYCFAASAGAAYMVATSRFPSVRLGRGAAFGTALWLIGDEVAVSAAGLENPFGTPVKSHCSALGAHIVYGMLVDALRPAVL